MGESLGDDLHNVKNRILEGKKTEQKCKVYWKKNTVSAQFSVKTKAKKSRYSDL